MSSFVFVFVVCPMGFGCFCTKNDNIGSEEVVLCTNTGRIVRQSLKDIPVQGRFAKGVRIQRLATKEQIAALTIPAKEEGKAVDDDKAPSGTFF